MARRPAGASDWLREALIERRVQMVERFDCPRTRTGLEDYTKLVRSGVELTLTATDIFLALYPLEPDAAERYAARNRPAPRWTLGTDNRLAPAD